MEGRALPSGVKAVRSKLSAEQVRDIRRLSKHGYSLRWIGDRYKISNVTVHNLLSGKTYRDVD